MTLVSCPVPWCSCVVPSLAVTHAMKVSSHKMSPTTSSAWSLSSPCAPAFLCPWRCDVHACVQFCACGRHEAPTRCGVRRQGPGGRDHLQRWIAECCRRLGVPPVGPAVWCRQVQAPRSAGHQDYLRVQARPRGVQAASCVRSGLLAVHHTTLTGSVHPDTWRRRRTQTTSRNGSSTLHPVACRGSVAVVPSPG